jgi:hypothetical protein
MTGEERKRYDDDVKFRNAVCEHGSQRRKCNTCDLLCEQHDNAALRADLDALRARINDVAGMAFVIAEDYCPVGMPTIVSPVDINVARAVSAWLKEGR